MKQSKNLVAAILLAFLLGPIGLFYASIWGGLIMTFTPIVFAILFSDGSIINAFAILFTYGLLTFVIYWPLCIVWAAIATIRHNKKVNEEEYYEQEIEKSYESSSPDEKMVEWLKANPTKGINDYFASNK